MTNPEESLFKLVGFKDHPGFELMIICRISIRKVGVAHDREFGAPVGLVFCL